MNQCVMILQFYSYLPGEVHSGLGGVGVGGGIFLGVRVPSVGTKGKTMGGGARRGFGSNKQISLAPVTKTMRTGWFFAGGLMAQTHKSPHRVGSISPYQ